MEQENEFTGRQSLELIESMISRARNTFTDNSHLYLLWGWVVFSCSVLQFLLNNVFHYERHYLVWMLTWLVAVYQVFYLAKKRKKTRVKTYSDHIINFVWISFIVSMVLMIFIIGRGLDDRTYHILNPVFLALYGIPTFLTGIIIRFKPLVTGGISCWVLSLGASFTPADYHVLLIAAAMLVAWIIPGYLLKAKFKKQNVLS